jgi:co-chaperonin GroES (HSP10)
MRHSETLEAIGNDQWISEAEVADPTPMPDVLGWKVLVRPVAIRRKTKGGIHLPDTVKDDLAYLTTVGRVVGVGPLAYRREDMLVNGTYLPWCKIGDFVSYGKFTGTKFVYKGVKLILLNDDAIMMRVENAETLDPMIAFMK